MPLDTVTNAEFTTALGNLPTLYSATYTRNTDLESAPTVSPNSNLLVSVTADDTGVTFDISYQQLQSLTQAYHIVKEAHGVRGLLIEAVALINALASIVGGVNYDPKTAPIQDYVPIMRAFANMPLGQFAALYPFDGYNEVNDSKTPLEAEFTLSQVDSTTTTAATITNVSTGYYHFVLVDWGDGAGLIHMEDESDWTRTFARAAMGAGDDAYEVTMILIGPQGVRTFTDTLTVPDQA